MSDTSSAPPPPPPPVATQGQASAPPPAGATGSTPAQATTATNQPGVQTVATNQNAAAGCTTTVTLNNTYKVLVKIGTYRKDNTGNTLNGDLKKLPYVMVYASPSAPDSWEIIKLGNISGGVLFPLAKAGNYRLYVKEPALVPALNVGRPFTIPFHMKADGTASTHEVQPFFAFKVTSPSCTTNTNLQLIPPFTVTTDLPNTLGRAANLYPTMGQTYTITEAQAKNTLTLNNFTNALDQASEDIFRITFQLWSDISQTYGHTHRIVQSSAYRTTLEKFYKEEMTATGHARTLEFKLAGQSCDRTIHFEAGGTEGARNTRSYATQTLMTASEAIRRIHPSVWDYWLGVMQACDITYVKITSAWRPHMGSVLHRYSIGLDFNHTKGIIQVPNPKYHSVDNPKTHLDQEVEISFRNNGPDETLKDCAPTTALSANSATVFTDRDKRITLSKKILNRIASDKIEQPAQTAQTALVGWTGGPWTLKYSDVGIANNENEFIKTDENHKDHIHLTIGTELN